mgnify:FL=1
METIEKTDLHIHLGGSFPMSYLETISTPNEIQQLKSFIQKMKEKGETMDYHACFGAFSLVSKIVNNNSKIENGTAALCQCLAADGVTYVEIRTSLKNLNEEGHEAYLNAIFSGIRKGCANTKLRAAILLSVKRNSSVEFVKETWRLCKLHFGYGTVVCEDGFESAKPTDYPTVLDCAKVVGIDISDDALLGNGEHVIPLAVMQEMRSMHVPVALHIGECVEETPEQQMNELNYYQPLRIGHGVFLCDEAKQFVYSRRLPIEMCLSSAVIAHMVTSAGEHPAIALLLDNYPVLICTDDPLIFETSNTKDCELAAALCNVSIADIARFQQNSKKYIFH